jgi:predicted PurR-regulated permease PerM
MPAPPASDPKPPGAPPPAQVQRRAFVALVVLVTLAFLWVVRGFLLPVFWAAVLAVLFRPLHARIRGRLGSREGVAAALSTLAVIVAVVVPLTVLGLAVASEATGLYERITSGDWAVLGWAERQLPLLADLLGRVGLEPGDLRDRVGAGAAAASQLVASRLVAIGQNTLEAAVLFGLMLYFLFFFFRDGEKIIDRTIRALPLGDRRERRLFSKFADVARATVKGTLVVAAVQGAIGGVLFWMLGIDAAVFWGVVMAVLSLLPAIGSALVWVPAAVILAASGEIGRAAILTGGGVLVIGLVDNLLRPILVGRDIEMPDYLVLIATLGGIAVFGLSGFVLGPVVAALFLVVWDMVIEEYGAYDDARPAPSPPLAAPPPSPSEAPPPTERPAPDPA